MLSRSQFVTLAVAASGLTALAACSHGNEGAALASIPAGPSHVLVFSDDGANAKLALADEPAALMLECAHGSRTVHVTHAAIGGPDATLTLASGGAADSVKADRQAFEGQTLVLADTTTDAPALSAFRRSGLIKVSYAGSDLSAGARPEPFFAACEGRAS